MVVEENLDPDFMDQVNRVAVLVDRESHDPVIYVDTVDSLQKTLRVLRALAAQWFDFAFIDLRRSLANV